MCGNSLRIDDDDDENDDKSNDTIIINGTNLRTDDTV
mgnify:CR=1 FL=1